jgi:hypothetical protein
MWCASHRPLPNRGGYDIGQSLERRCPDFPVLRPALICAFGAAGREHARPAAPALGQRGVLASWGVCGCLINGRHGITACLGGSFHAGSALASAVSTYLRRVARGVGQG